MQIINVPWLVRDFVVISDSEVTYPELIPLCIL